MLLMLGDVVADVVADVGNVLDLEARRRLSPLATPLMRGGTAEGVRSGKW
jgi:hypothetical protein